MSERNPTKAVIDGRDALFEVRKTELAEAWREQNPEFSTALDLAIMCGLSGPLKEYIASGNPLSRADGERLVAFIERLEQHIPTSKPPAGRPKRKPDAAPKAQAAERNAAILVAALQAAWRKEHRRERVPAAETDRMIAVAVKEAAKAFDIRAELINQDNIRNALKTGRIVVPY